MKNGSGGIWLKAHRGRQEDLTDLEAARHQRSNELARAYRATSRWQCIALGLLGTTVLGIAGLVWHDTLGVRVEYGLIRVDAHGQEQIVSSLPTVPLNVEQSIIHGVVYAWIENVRSISNDPVVFGGNWDKVRDFTTQAGLKQLDPFMREQDQRQRAGRRIQVQVGNFLPIGQHSGSYTVEWKELVYDRSGQLLADESGIGKATVAIADFQSVTAKYELDLRRKQKHYRNVYGIFVDEVSWVFRPLEGKQS